MLFSSMLTCFRPSGHLPFWFRVLQVTFAFLACPDVLAYDFSCFRVIFTALCVPAHGRPIRMASQAIYTTYVPVLWPTGELGGLALLWVMLTSSIAFPVVFAPIRVHCMCMHALDAFVSFSGLCGSSGCNFGLVPGKFGVCQSFGGFLAVSDMCFQTFSNRL